MMSKVKSNLSEKIGLEQVWLQVLVLNRTYLSLDYFIVDKNCRKSRNTERDLHFIAFD